MLKEEYYSKILILALFMAFIIGFAASESNLTITEAEDNFNNTYNFGEKDTTSINSDEELVFDGETELQLCVTEVEHREGANLKYRNRTEFIEDNCWKITLTPEMYDSDILIPRVVVDKSLPYEPSDRVTVRYNNTLFPDGSEEEEYESTNYDNILLDKEKYEEIQEEKDRIQEKNENLENQLESKNNTVQNLENEVNDLEEELAQFRSGLTNWINSIF